MNNDIAMILIAPLIFLLAVLILSAGVAYMTRNDEAIRSNMEFCRSKQLNSVTITNGKGKFYFCVNEKGQLYLGKT